MPATKAAYAAELTAVMAREGVSRAELARRMHTSRSTVGRVLDPADESVTLSTLSRAAAALGREPAVSLAPERASVLLERHREKPRRIAEEHGLENVVVCGSVARGTDATDSDLDLVADIPEELDLFAVAVIVEAMSAALGRTVDLGERRCLRPRVRETVERDSVPL
jgi:predicted nucleotidyltransferase